jgi:hypothetical protein
VVYLSVIEELDRKSLGPLRLSRRYSSDVIKQREFLDQLKEYQLQGSTSPLQIQTSAVDVSKENTV